jgi:hypothetical protein
MCSVARRDNDSCSGVMFSQRRPLALRGREGILPVPPFPPFSFEEFR